MVGVLAGTRLVAEARPVLRFEQSTWEDYLAARSSNLRQQIRRYERRLQRSYDVRFTSPATAAEFEVGLDDLFALHRARCANAKTSFSRHEDFHREFARIA